MNARCLLQKCPISDLISGCMIMTRTLFLRTKISDKILVLNLQAMPGLYPYSYFNVLLIISYH